MAKYLPIRTPWNTEWVVRLSEPPKLPLDNLFKLEWLLRDIDLRKSKV